MADDSALPPLSAIVDGRVFGQSFLYDKKNMKTWVSYLKDHQMLEELRSFFITFMLGLVKIVPDTFMKRVAEQSGYFDQLFDKDGPVYQQLDEDKIHLQMIGYKFIVVTVLRCCDKNTALAVHDYVKLNAPYFIDSPLMNEYKLL